MPCHGPHRLQSRRRTGAWIRDMITRVEKELADHAYIPHIRRIGEEKTADGDKTHPARRWVVERTLAWLKGFRAIRTRYFCRAKNYLAMLHLACACIISRKLAAD
jgi:putative transposase